MARYMFAFVLCLPVLGYSQEAAPPDAPEAVEPAAEVAVEVVAPVADSMDPSVVSALLEAVTQAGVPDDFSVRSIATYVVYVVIIAALAYFGKKYRDNEDLKQFFRDADAATDHVYITKLEGKHDKDQKINGPLLREAGMEFLNQMKGPTVRIIKKKGVAWVTAQVHRMANRKAAEGAKAKAAKQVAAADALS